MKSEADCYSIDDLQKEKKTLWTGIRNYQVRNFIRDKMKSGDMALFYHSSSKPTGAVGIMKVTSRGSLTDPTQFDRNDEHYDSKASKEKPIWAAVEVQFVEKFVQPVTLEEIKFRPELKGIPVADRGSRLSIQPVSEAHFQIIRKIGMNKK
jgi:predicted RNA-binding protein with PUA-like domain